jgi:hypothetical protein
MDKIYAVIPKRSLVYLLICMSGVLIIFAAGIIPEYFSSVRLDQQIKNIQFQIEEQKRLYPIHQMLQSKTHTEDGRTLPFPKKNFLSRTQMDVVPATFREIAKKANLDIVSASPDLNFLGTESRFLPINATMRGDFFNFRKFLISLGEVSYLERIEEIQIQQNEDTMEFKIKVWLVLAQKAG